MARIDFRFVIGVIFGIVIALFYTEATIANYRQTVLDLQRATVQQHPIEDDHNHNLPPDIPNSDNHSGSNHSHDGNLVHSHEKNRITDVLFDRVKVLCWIMTHPTDKNLKKVKAVNETWSQRCNKVIYFSTDPKLGLETVDLQFQDGRNHLWGKTKKVLEYLHHKYGKDYDWFFKADDDTFAVMENLRYLVAPHNPEDDLMMGCTFKLNKYFYNSGGAGYIMSRGALNTFVTRALVHPKCPKGEGGPEDYNLGVCMNSVGVNVTDTRDAVSRLRFLPLSASAHFNDQIPNWLEKYLTNDYGHRENCCSNLLITFHYISPEMMYLLEFFTYDFNVFGRLNHYNVEHEKLTDDQLFQQVQQQSQKNRP